MEPTQQQLDCRQDFQFFLAQVICFLGFKRRTTSKYFFFFSFPFQAITYFKQQPRKPFCFSHFHPWGTQAQRLKGREQHRRGGTRPQQGKAHSFKFYFHLGKCRENNRQAKRAAQPCPQAWDMAGRRPVAISVMAPEDSLSDRCVGSYRAAVPRCRNGSNCHRAR